MSYKKNLGQYFTSNIELKKKVFEFILNVPLTILEPSIGRGRRFNLNNNPLNQLCIFIICSNLLLISIYL